MCLYKNTYPNKDISEKIDIIKIVAKSDMVIAIHIAVSNISGICGVYKFDLCLNDALVVPSSVIDIPSGINKFVVQNRQIILIPGDSLVISARGLINDNDVTLNVMVVDMASIYTELANDVPVAVITDQFGINDIIGS